MLARRWFSLCAIGCLVALVAACSTETLRRGAACAPADRIAAYRTFAWVGAPRKDAESTFISPASLEKLEAAVVEMMQRKGYIMVPDGQAQMWLGYRISTDVHIDPRALPLDEYDCAVGRPNVPPQVARTYEEGTLRVLVTERATGDLLYDGWVNKEITQTDRGNPTALAYRAAASALDGFPDAR